MSVLNEMRLEFQSRSANISFARAAVAAFVSQLDPTLPDIDDISTAVSEAVTNAIVHGYGGNPNGIVRVVVRLLSGDLVEIVVEDKGVGIPDPATAKEFGKTSQPEERIGIGFNLMDQCMDEVVVTTAEPAKNSSSLQPSGFIQFLRRGLGLDKKIKTSTKARGAGTRVLMRKHLQKQGD